MKNHILPVLLSVLALTVMPGCRKMTTNNDDFVYVAVTGISLNYSEETLAIGGTLQLYATVSPSNASEKNVTWTSSKPAVASVSEDGLVTTTLTGYATITASCGGHKAECHITVTNEIIHVTGLSLDPDNIVLNLGGKKNITPRFQPTNATNHNVAWLSGNDGVATVENGVVTAKGYGTTTITATAEDGGHKATATVKVVKPYSSIAITSPTESDSHYDTDKGKFVFLIGEEIQLVAEGSPSDAEDAIEFSSAAGGGSYDISDGGLLKLNSTGSNCKVRAHSKADDNIYAEFVFDVLNKPTGITLKEKDHTGTTTHLGVGTSHNYTVTVEPSGAPQNVVVSGSSKCTASIDGSTLTINIPSTAVASTTSSQNKATVVLRADGGYQKSFEFIISKLDPWQIKIGDVIDKNGQVHDGGYRGNSLFTDSESPTKYPNSIVAWVGNAHTTEDPFWASYQPSTGVKVNGTTVHGIAIPVNISKLYRSSYSNGEYYYNDGDNDNYILESGNQPKWLKNDNSKKELMKSTSTKHSAFMNTCCHVYTNAGHGSSFEIIPFNYFYNDHTKKPSKDLGESNSMNKNDYVFANDFTDNLDLSSFNAKALNEPTAFTIGGKYMTSWLCPTIADLYSIFVDGTLTSSGAFSVEEIHGSSTTMERITVLKKSAMQWGNDLNYVNIPWWVANESGRDGGTLYLCQVSITSDYYFKINRKAKRTDRAFILPIRYF